MKSIILKKMTPVAVFVLGISGAFFTTSMQSSSKTSAPILGYVDNLDGGSPCDIAVNCDTEIGDLCRQFDDSGPQAKTMDSPTTCAQQVYRPD
jgi:hypothetical protein